MSPVIVYALAAEMGILIGILIGSTYIWRRLLSKPTRTEKTR